MQETGGAGWKQELAAPDFVDEDEPGWLSYYFTKTIEAPQGANYDLLIEWDQAGKTHRLKMFEDIALSDLISNIFADIPANDPKFG